MAAEKTPTNLMLLDVVRELRRRGRHQDADYYLYMIPTMLMPKGIYPEDAYAMTVDELQMELNKPIAPSGWDRTTWGKAIVCPPS